MHNEPYFLFNAILFFIPYNTHHVNSEYLLISLQCCCLARTLVALRAILLVVLTQSAMWLPLLQVSLCWNCFLTSQPFCGSLLQLFWVNCICYVLGPNLGTKPKQKFLDAGFFKIAVRFGLT